MFLIRLCAVLCCALLLAACDRPPEFYAPPEQRHPAVGYNSGPDAMMVDMGDPDASLRIVKDIHAASDPAWRWTSQNPTLRLLLLSTEHLTFNADFAIWDDGFKTTGPLEIQFLVNGRLLDKVRYTTPGVKHFEKPVPATWLEVDTDTNISMFVDKLFTSPRDGDKFGVILTRMGFRP
jgi:hypothetical protein